MSYSGQVSNTTQEQILNLQEEINLQLVLLESIDDSVSNRQVLEKEIRERLRILRQQYQNLRKNLNPIARESSTSSFTSHSTPVESGSFNSSLETHTFDSGFLEGLNHSALENHDVGQYSTLVYELISLIVFISWCLFGHWVIIYHQSLIQATMR